MKKYFCSFVSRLNPFLVALLLFVLLILRMKPTGEAVLVGALLSGVITIALACGVESSFQGHRVLGWRRILRERYIALSGLMTGCLLCLCIVALLLFSQESDPVERAYRDFLGLILLVTLILALIDFLGFSWESMAWAREGEWRRILKKEGKSPEDIEADVRQKRFQKLLRK